MILKERVTAWRSSLDLAASVSGGMASLLGALAVLGWITGLRSLSSFRPNYIPMSPDSAFLFVVLGTILVLRIHNRYSTGRKYLLPTLAAIISIYGLLKFFEYFTKSDLTFENLLFPATESIGSFLIKRMSPVTGFMFFLSGLTLILEGIFSHRRRILNVIAVLGMVIAIAGFVATVGYVFGTPLLYGGDIIPLAATTSLGFIFLGFGLVALSGPGSIFGRLFADDLASSKLLRVMLPLTFAAVLLQGLLFEKLPAKLGLSEALVVAFLSLILAALMSVVVFQVSRFIFRRADEQEAERRQAEAALRESEDRYRDLVEHSSDLICTHDLAGNILSSNAVAGQLLGYTQEDIARMNFRDILAPESKRKFEIYIREIAKKGKSSGSMVILAKSGEKRYWEFNNTLRTEGVAVPIVRGMARDFTERKKAENRAGIFSKLGESLNAATTAYEAAKTIAAASEALFGWEAFSLDLYQHDRNTVTPILNFDTIDGKRVDVTPAYLDCALTPRTKKCLQGQGELILRNVGDTFMEDALPFGDFNRPSLSLMYVPIRSAGHVSGVLSIQSYKPGAFSEADLQTLQSLADYCGGAIERIRKVMALNESEEQLRSVWNNSVDGMRLTDSKGLIVNVNNAYCDLVKIRRERLIGKLFSVVYGDQEADDVIESYREHFTNNTFKPRLSNPVEMWNHEILDLEISTSSIEFGNQEKLLLCIFRDITDRKKAENALKTQTAYFEQLFEDSPLGIAILDNDDKLVSINRSFEQMFQFSGDEIRGKKINDCIIPVVFAEEAEELSRATLRGESVTLETVRMRKDGTLTQVKIVGYPIKVRDVQLGIYAMYEDINERKAADAKIAEQARLLDVALDGIIVRDMSDTLIYWNHAAEVMFGWTFEEARSAGVGKLLAKGERKKYEEARKLFVEHGTWQGEFKELTRDGREIVIESRWTMVRDRKGIPTARLIINRDVTKQKQLEAELTQIQKMDGIGTLASGIAHDFNNILGIILGYSALIERIPDDGTSVLQSVHAINAAVQRGAGLVKQILTFARKTEVFIGPVDVNIMVKEMGKMLRETFTKSIDFSVQLGKNIPFINADATQLHQALLNLCVNARDAMPAGGILSMSTEVVQKSSIQNEHPEADSLHYILVKIADTGTGMDDATRSHIFEPFFTTKEKGKGTGLGLSVVYGVMKNHNGLLDVHSEPGKGTIFSLYFPVPEEDDAVSGKHAVTQEEIRGGDETILVVEDEELLLSMVKSVLEGKGYRVMTATNGQLALDTFREHRNEISLVLSDIGLPRLSGDKLYHELKKINPSVRVILASGYFDQQIKSEILEAGAKDFIQKPYDLDDVLRKIRETLDMQKEIHTTTVNKH